MKRKILGFTLIELLVVIIIAGVLMAILLPTMRSGRELAKRAQCANNLRQLGMAMLMYLEENNDVFPGYFSGGVYWQARVNRYIDDTKIWYCPKQPANGYIATGFINLPFAYNNFIGSGNVAIKNIAKPSETILFSDSTVFGGFKYWSICGSINLVPAKRHQDGDNYLFVGGHMKWCSYEEIWGSGAGQHGLSSPDSWWNLN